MMRKKLFAIMVVSLIHNLIDYIDVFFKELGLCGIFIIYSRVNGAGFILFYE